MDILKFDERLYTLDVEEVPKEEIPRIIDPNYAESSNGIVVCYRPTNNQLIQLALMVWQVGARDRMSSTRSTSKFYAAEQRCMVGFSVLRRLLFPFVNGDKDKAEKLCKQLLLENKPILDKYIGGWKAIPRPNSVWVDKDEYGIFLCQNRGRILVGLNPTDYVFTYNPEKN